VAAWIGGILVLLVAGHLSGTRLLSNAEASVGQSGQAARMIRAAQELIDVGAPFLLVDHCLR